MSLKANRECIRDLYWTLVKVAQWLVWCHFWLLWMWATVSWAGRLLPEIGLSLKPNQQNQVSLWESLIHIVKWTKIRSRQKTHFKVPSKCLSLVALVIHQWRHNTAGLRIERRCWLEERRMKNMLKGSSKNDVTNNLVFLCPLSLSLSHLSS